VRAGNGATVSARTKPLGWVWAVRQTALGVVMLLVTAPSCSAEIPLAVDSGALTRIVRVIDGDTIKVVVDGREESCRLLGIDTPELSYGRLTAQLDRIAVHTPDAERPELEAAIAVVSRHADLAEGRAREARAALKHIVGGRAVILVPDSIQPARGRFGRLLVYVEVDGLDANAELVRRGLAIVDERFECDRLDDYVKIQSETQADAVTGGNADGAVR